MALDVQIGGILVATDFSDAARDAVRHAAAIAGRTGAELIVLHVVQKFMDHSLLYSDVWPFQKPVRDYYRELERQTEDRLTRLTREIVGEAIPFRVVVTTGSPHRQIVAAIKKEGADMVVISSHGHSGLAHALLGSTAERVLRKAPCPVLVVRSGTAGFVVGSPD
jgi:nucleotide-binding universal stress UspA family protein